MEKGKGEANTVNLAMHSVSPRADMRGATHCEYTIAPPILTVHLDVVVAPFLDKMYRGFALHYPRQHGVQTEYELGERISPHP